MGPFLCEDFRSESFPYCNWKLIKRRDSGDKGDTGRSGDSEIELFSHTMIRNFSYAIRKAGRTFCVRFYCCSVRTQESFGQRLGDERTRSDFRLKVSFRMKPGESDVYSESRYSQVSGKLARGRESGGVVVESCRNQLIANLAVKLFMKRLICSAVEPARCKRLSKPMRSRTRESFSIRASSALEMEVIAIKREAFSWARHSLRPYERTRCLGLAIGFDRPPTKKGL